MKAVRIPPLAPVLFLLGLAVVLLWPQPGTKRDPADPLVQQVDAFFAAIDIAPEPGPPLSAAQVQLATTLYGAPPERLRIMQKRLLTIEAGPRAERAITTVSVTAHDIGTEAVVKRTTRLYWHRDAAGWRLDTDASLIDALTVNFLRVVREGDAAGAAAFLHEPARTPEAAARLIERYRWRPKASPLSKPFRVVSVDLAPGAERATSTALWQWIDSGEEHAVAIPWVRAGGSWWVDAPPAP